MENLLMLANLGRVRAFSLRPAGLDPQEKPHFIELPNSPIEMRPEAINEIASDQAGRFPRGGAINRQAGMSYGENHNLAGQIESQALQRVAAAIGQLVYAQGYPKWRLVAPQPILSTLEQALSPQARAVLGRTEPADLTHETLAQLEERFLGPRQ
jgi:hypothetical protein